MLDFLHLNDLRAQKDLNSSKKYDNNSSTIFLNSNRNSEKHDELKKSTSTINSTLSLHITAYENSIEATNDLKSSEEEVVQSKGECSGMAIKWKTPNHFVDGTTSIIQKPFEFPRQQKDESSRPELMAFTASQRLLNPNQMDENNQIQPPPVSQQKK
uniref:Prolactin receptor n=1 Tax=Panagrolaimus sp. ES5 TaxID=591445 RepID=A0AC34G1V8_9BILA